MSRLKDSRVLAPEIHISTHWPRPSDVSDAYNVHPAVLPSELQSQTQPPERRRDGCTECRRKKIKCDFRTPVCSRCVRYPQECKYVSKFIAMGGERSATRRVAQRRRTRVNTPETVKQIEAKPQNESRSASMSIAPSSSFMSRIQEKMSIQAIVSETTVVFPLASRNFLDQLLSSAMETPHLLFALLASSDSHARRRLASSRPDDMALSYTNNAISGLRAALADERNANTSVEMAMTAMALCTNDVCNGNLELFRVHLAGVSGMLTSGLLERKKDPFATYLFKWFAALDVSAGLSLVHKSTLLSGELYQSCRAALAASVEEGVDDICGYSLELLPILAEVGELARERYTHPEQRSLCERGAAIEARIAALSGAEYHHGQLNEKHNELRTTHTAFMHTALLHLHRRVYLLPKMHPTVRNNVWNILDTVRSVRSASTANILLLWPIFSAGCETDEKGERELIDERMSIMQDIGMGNFTRARNILKRFWASSTELRWDLWLAEEGIDLVLF
ncbi:fungal-specific transcription factor domain-containing protein [Aspergillus granulosus]|uniref:Fungal-specific transcription factor domain-containing protein n=1 Tax=Aspergillus granulosus TaxID=176169 RepID=A0ABR4H3R6_9EURO